MNNVHLADPVGVQHLATDVLLSTKLSRRQLPVILRLSHETPL